MPLLDKEKNIVRASDSFEVPEVSLGAYYKAKLDEILATEPNKISVICPRNDEQLRLKDLDERARSVAAWFVKIGKIESVNDRVYFFGDNSIDYLVSMLAVFYLGVCYSPGTPANGPYEVANQLENLSASALVVSTGRVSVIERMLKSEQAAILNKLKFILILEDQNDPECVDRLSTLATTTKVVSYQKLVKQFSADLITSIPYFSVNVHTDYCMIVYTSGTTGMPKGAIHSSYSMVASMENLARTPLCCDYAGSRALVTFPFGHLSGSYITPGYIMARMTVILLPSPAVEVREMMSLLEKYRIEIFTLPNALSKAMVDTDFRQEFDLSNLKAFFYGSTKYHEHAIRTIAERYNVRPNEGYGCTEMVRMVGETSEPDKPRPWSLKNFKFGSLGPPMPNVALKIVDINNGHNLSANQEGEVCFHGPNCFIGYLNNKEATKETIDEQGWYHTGDLGYYDDHGELYITDRIKEMIKYKGWSVSPTEVETFITTHPAVSGTCVVGVPHQTEGAHLRAYVQRTPGGEVTEQELIDYVREHMGYQKRLNAGVVFLKSGLVRSISGKIDRAYYRKLVKDEVLVQPAEA